MKFTAIQVYRAWILREQWHAREPRDERYHRAPEKRDEQLRSTY